MKQKALQILRTVASFLFGYVTPVCIAVLSSGCRESVTSTNNPPANNPPFTIVWEKSTSFASVVVPCLSVNSLGMVFAADESGNIYRSTNTGADWVQLSVTGAVGTFTSFTFPGNDTILAANELSGIFRSTNFGDTWESIGDGLTGSGFLSIATLSNGHIIAGSTTGKLFISTDNGEIWTFQVNLARSIVAIIHTPSNALLLSAWSDGVYRFYESSKTITNADAGLGNPYVYCFTADPFGYIYAGTYESGVFRSSDDGDSWQHYDNGPEHTQVQTLVSSSSGQLFAGTSSGAFRSVDRGLHWTSIDSGMTTYHILSMAVSSNTLFAGTDSGIFRAKLEKSPKP